MYLDHFGLIETPFSIAPDPRYLYMSERHREALAHLLYGMESDGAFILLTGDVGTGKTTVSRCLLEQVPEDTNLALVLNPKLNAIELLQVICDELRIVYDHENLSVKSLVDYINRYLLGAHAQGKKTVVLIEEAQNLDLDVLEQLRLLTNLETNERKLLQVILLGQPEFLDVLDRPELSQLAQRITARFHLTPLKLKEAEEYIAHRLAIAGCRRPLFAHGVIRWLFNYSGGVPRLINVICDRALLGCYVQNRQQIDKHTLQNAAKEVLGEKKSAAITLKNNKLFTKMALAMFMLLLVGGGVYFADYFSAFKAPQFEDNIGSATNKNEGLENPLSLISTDIKIKIEENTYIQWPDTNQRLRSNLHSFYAVFEAWKIDYQLSVDGTPCYYAQTQGFSCFHGNAEIEGLRKLNRPAVLTLYDDLNQPQYAALIKLDKDSAKIHIAEKTQIISLQQLQFYWKGEFTLLWRPPPGYEDIIRPGTDGRVVVWLSKAMNQIDKKVENNGRSYYDEELVKQIKLFQLQQGLIDDGVVGVKTLIHINQKMFKDAPELETS